MKEKYPAIRLRDRRGMLSGRDGIVLSFFIPRDHPQVAPAIWRAIQTYRHAIPPLSLNWYTSDDGDMVPLDDQGWEHNRREVLECPGGRPRTVELLESPSEAGSYQVEYYGRRMDDVFDEAPATTVSFTFPTEYLLERGAAHLRTLALELAYELPFSFGYASFAIVAPQGYWDAEAREALDALCTRYLGLDLSHVRKTSQVIGTHARGASWLTFLGQPLLGQLGGIEELRRAIPFPDVSFLPLEGERLLITLGEWPDAIDTEKSGIPPQYRGLAHQLKPFLYNERDDEPLKYIHRWLLRLSG